MKKCYYIQRTFKENVNHLDLCCGVFRTYEEAVLRLNEIGNEKRLRKDCESTMAGDLIGITVFDKLTGLTNVFQIKEAFCDDDFDFDEKDVYYLESRMLHFSPKTTQLFVDFFYFSNNKSLIDEMKVLVMDGIKKNDKDILDKFIYFTSHVDDYKILSDNFIRINDNIYFLLFNHHYINDGVIRI